MPRSGSPPGLIGSNSFCERVKQLNTERTNDMSNWQLKGNWNEVKGKLKQKYGQLTDDDLTFAEGKEDEMLGRLQKKLGKRKEEIRTEIESL